MDYNHYIVFLKEKNDDFLKYEFKNNNIHIQGTIIQKDKLKLYKHHNIILCNSLDYATIITEHNILKKIFPQTNFLQFNKSTFFNI
jgi:hypothetical protein